MENFRKKVDDLFLKYKGRYMSRYNKLNFDTEKIKLYNN
jgi:hypothetical protein